mmetsp:Transcript_32606/g.74999  ORF Transcript_32606/g.74999 Transcript_32606/m.74999 type:complete len:97 (+) Transcript_32606:441-731(+)
MVLNGEELKLETSDSDKEVPTDAAKEQDTRMENATEAALEATPKTKRLLGMVVGFTLSSSSYATIALRELTKRPTSSEYQRGLRLEGRCEGENETP